MPESNTFRRRTTHISKALIQQYLEDSDVESDIEHETTCADLPNIESLCLDSNEQGCVVAEDLSDCKLWLDQLCIIEHARIIEASENDSSWRGLGPNGEDPLNDEQDSYRTETVGACPAMDTTVLQRIREGRGPRDTIPEDLLAAFRESPRPDHAETYGEMRELLMSWIKRQSGGIREDHIAGEMLEAAIERRVDLLKAPSYEVNQEAVTESAHELLHGLTALRPEITDFKTQDPFEIMVMMWANVRLTVPDMDDTLRLLTMKALLSEAEFKLYRRNAEKLSGMARSLSVARLQVDVGEVQRLEAKLQAFKGKLQEAVVKLLIDRIKVGRRELTQAHLKELQKLTELQAAQMWAAHTKLDADQHGQNQSRACEQAEGRLRRVLQQQVPELDAHVHVVQSNAHALAGMSANLLSQATEAGFSLEDKHSSALFEPVTDDVKAYVTRTIADIVDAREEAAKMLDRLGAVESHLDVLLDAAKSQYREYDALRLLLPAESCTANDDVQARFAEAFGPRRESILLMTRGEQRTKPK